MSKCPDCNSIKMLAFTMGLKTALPETTMCWGCQPELPALSVLNVRTGPTGELITQCSDCHELEKHKADCPQYHYIHMSEPAYWEESYCKCSCHKQAARSCSECVPCTGGPNGG